MKILAIETSCDETAASVAEIKRGKIKILSNIISSQINIHKKYGGVIPEVAAREHVLKILPVVTEALKKANIPYLNNIGNKKFIQKNIKAIGVTIGPGLITSLITGVETTKNLSFAWNLPLIGINHIEGHIYANFIDHKPEFPALVLTVSGGHNILVLMTNHGKYKILGQTRDDAAGEAFDKVAKILGLPYPGGVSIEKISEKYNKEEKNIFPSPMINSPDFDFSFSGLKTAVLYKVKKDRNYKKNIKFYASEFQQAVVDVLIAKTIKAAKKYKVKSIALTGGVSANKKLRKQLDEKIKKEFPKIKFFVPDFKYCTDNAAMIACAAYYKYKNKKSTDWKKIKVNCNAKL